MLGAFLFLLELIEEIYGIKNALKKYLSLVIIRTIL